jgi:hydroxypyruvate isomerase
MQIDEGDIIGTLETIIFIGHYHTACVQEEMKSTILKKNYSAIMKAIHETGFKGYVAQEFIPKKTQAESLKRHCNL